LGGGVSRTHSPIHYLSLSRARARTHTRQEEMRSLVKEHKQQVDMGSMYGRWTALANSSALTSLSLCKGGGDRGKGKIQF
jgi:hypothetical protein